MPSIGTPIKIAVTTLLFSFLMVNCGQPRSEKLSDCVPNEEIVETYFRRINGSGRNIVVIEKEKFTKDMYLFRVNDPKGQFIVNIVIEKDRCALVLYDRISIN